MGLGGKERLEDPFAILRRDAFASIFDRSCTAAHGAIMADDLVRIVTLPPFGVASSAFVISTIKACSN